jgi:hypothetical protein
MPAEGRDRLYCTPLKDDALENSTCCSQGARPSARPARVIHNQLLRMIVTEAGEGRATNGRATSANLRSTK